MQKTDTKLYELLSLIKILRGENGCPWDRKQTAKTLIKYLREETEELINGIAEKDTENVCEELGDLLYLILMITDIHSDNQDFTLLDVIDGISKKLIRRHPHVFSDVVIKNEQDLQKQWEAIKQAEKDQK